jgi:hypothetical protein
MFIKFWHVWSVDAFEKCVEVTKDPQYCMSLLDVGRLVGGLVECVAERRGAKECYYACLKMCQGERCDVACLSALEAALGVAAARDLARKAALAVSLMGLSPIDAVALAFDAEVKRVEEKNCPEREVAARVLAAASVELYKNFKKVPSLRSHAQDVLLLMAPALAAAYRCVGEAVFEYLDFIKPFVEEEAVKRIVAAMEEGAALVGNVVIRFRPVGHL